MTFFERLESERPKGTIDAEWCRILGVPRSTYDLWKLGRDPRLVNVERVSKATGLNPSWLAFGSKPKRITSKKLARRGNRKGEGGK